MGTIVVGVDGSPSAQRALAFALAEARLRGDQVVVVSAWTVPLAQSLPGPVIGGLPLEYGLPIDDLRAASRRHAEELIHTALEDAGELTDAIAIERRPVEGPAAQALLEAAAGADLLVVGSRGRGGFAGLVLGSVGQQCAHHAPCPIAIVPGASGRR